LKKNFEENRRPPNGEPSTSARSVNVSFSLSTN